MATVDSQATIGSLYRAIWRWHFLIGLWTLPFLVLLAVTGGIYLFKPELDRLAYPSLHNVQHRAGSAAPSQMVSAAEASTGGKVLQITLPHEPGRSARMIVRMPSGEARSAFADPHDGRFLGSTHYGGVMQTIRKIHSLQLFGFWASSLMEIAAGWATVMVGTGFILWWPRGRSGGVASVRGSPARRLFWRDLHAVTGAGAGILILFLALTGMPWSMVWGDYVHRWTTQAGLGEPPPPAETMPEWMIAQKQPPAPTPEHHEHQEEVNHDLPWAVQRLAPVSGAAARSPIGVDEAHRRALSHGLARPFNLAAPVGPGGAWVASYAPPRAEDVRTLYFDQYDGRLLADVRFGDYGAAAKAISWGIQVHQGDQYGGVNRYVMLAGCVAIVLLAVTSVTMWWKRRPRGRLGVPRLPADPRTVRGVLAAMVVIGMIFPLVGLSLLTALLLEWGLTRVSRLGSGSAGRPSPSS